MATIYDIAKIAEVSPATVSRVINGRSGVKDETVARIRKAMERAAFQPRWKAVDRNRLLVLVPDHRGALDSSYVSRILGGISDTAFASGFALQLRPFSPQIRNNAEIKRMIMAEGVSGIIIITLFQGYSLAERLSLATIPHAIVGYKTQDDGVSQILLDDFNAGVNATEYLLSLQHRKIAMVSFRHEDHGHQQRYAGYLQAMKAMGSAECYPCVQAETASAEEGRNAARRLLTLPNRPTAVIVTNEDIAVGFHAQAAEMGIRIPEDLSVLGFEESDKLSFLNPPMTAMRIPVHAMGMEAVRVLFAMLGEGEGAVSGRPLDDGQTFAERDATMLPLSLIVRLSTGMPA